MQQKQQQEQQQLASCFACLCHLPMQQQEQQLQHQQQQEQQQEPQQELSLGASRILAPALGSSREFPHDFLADFQASFLLSIFFRHPPRTYLLWCWCPKASQMEAFGRSFGGVFRDSLKCGNRAHSRTGAWFSRSQGGQFGMFFGIFLRGVFQEASGGVFFEMLVDFRAHWGVYWEPCGAMWGSKWEVFC